MGNIFEFCNQQIKQNPAYQGKHFQKLLVLTEIKSLDRSTTLGPRLGDVSEKNRGETAFQRALYKHLKKTLLVAQDIRTELRWRDLELPIILSNNARRRCIDLIGHTDLHGTFFCELKYKKGKSAPPGNAIDYAIFQALLYCAIIRRDYPLLDKNKVYGLPESPSFSWEAVSKSSTPLVLANDFYFTKALQSPNIERIKNLLIEIGNSLKINVLLCSVHNYAFKPEELRDGRYMPKLTPVSEKISISEETFPRYRLFATCE